MASMCKIAGYYDILHFHYFSVLPFAVDLPLWRRQGKRIIFHYHGDDIRNKGEGMLSRRYADAVLVSTPDLLAFSPRAKWIANPIDLRKYPYIGAENRNSRLRIVHAPSAPKVKGTEFVLEAVEGLKREGYEIELNLIKNLPHQEAVEHYKRADIVVDQLLVGWYGVFAIECMSLGKPVCVYIREELKKHLPATRPLVATSPRDIKEDLRRLIEDEDLRNSIGKTARSFVEASHDADKIAEHLINRVY
jgi:glycosyltransferase involved in cell wall biosynthesis